MLHEIKDLSLLVVVTACITTLTCEGQKRLESIAAPTTSAYDAVDSAYETPWMENEPFRYVAGDSLNYSLLPPYDLQQYVSEQLHYPSEEPVCKKY